MMQIRKKEKNLMKEQKLIVEINRAKKRKANPVMSQSKRTRNMQKVLLARAKILKQKQNRKRLRQKIQKKKRKRIAQLFLMMKTVKYRIAPIKIKSKSTTAIRAATKLIQKKMIKEVAKMILIKKEREAVARTLTMKRKKISGMIPIETMIEIVPRGIATIQREIKEEIVKKTPTETENEIVEMILKKKEIERDGAVTDADLAVGIEVQTEDVVHVTGAETREMTEIIVMNVSLFNKRKYLQEN